MKSHCGPYVLGNKTRCMACVTSMFIGLRETELLIEIFNKSSASFLLLSQMAEKLWCSGKKKKKTTEHDMHKFSGHPLSS